METSVHVEHVSSGAGDDTQTGHWFPALRPETIEEMTHDAPIAEVESSSPPHASIDIIPPTPVSRQGEKVEFPSQRIPVVPEEPGEPEPEPERTTATTAASQASTTNYGGEELPSDDDDERLDPTWGITRYDSTNILANVHRSSTFPDFDSPHAANHEVETGVPADKLDVGMVNGTAEGERVVEQKEDATEPRNLDGMNGADDSTREPQSWTIPAQEEIIDEADQRYEEGLPLIHTEKETPAQPQSHDKQTAQNPFETVQDDDDTSFFSNVPGSGPEAPQQPSLDRKTTTQVLDSLNISNRDLPDSPAADTPVEASFFDELAADAAPVADKNASAGVENQDPEAMWAAALGDDEFLVEDADDLLPDSDDESSSVPPTQPVSQTVPQQQPQRQSSVNPYTPHQPTTSDMFQLPPMARATHNNVGLSRPELPPAGSFQAQLPPRSAAPSVKSFVDQAKDGYKSPYDLPLDLMPKRRSHVPQPVQTAKSVAPPPRSSSLSEHPLQSPFAPAGPATSSSVGMQPQAPSPAMPQRSVSALGSNKTRPSKSGSSSGFFEELPITSKPRPAGRYTPQQSFSAAPPAFLPQSPPTGPLPPPAPLPQGPLNQLPGQHPLPAQPSDPNAQYQLQAPERLDPYANVPLQPPAPLPAPPTTRYSPAPPAPGASTLGARPGPSPRYSPAPPPQTTSASAARYAAQPTPSPGPNQAPFQANPALPTRPPSLPPPTAAAILPFQPRTSSPLAYHKGSVDENANGMPAATAQPSGPPVPTNQYIPSAASAPYSAASPESGNYGDLKNQLSPPKRPDAGHVPPPRRSQTQSPSKQRPQAAHPSYNADFINRPATAYGQSSPSITSAQLASGDLTRPNVQGRSLVPDLVFVRPQDDTQFDPLERWKGAPVFTFGFGGTITSSFPRHVPRYATGAVRPQIKPTPGEISIRDGKDILPQVELVNNFPGPLRSKSKKKDVLSWMTNYITGMEAGMPNIFAAQSHDDPARRLHEKVLLWKIVRVMVEHDGSLEGPALKAINLILSPEVHNVDESSPIQYRAGEQSSGIYRPSGANVRPDSADPMAVEALRKRLLSGDRQGAVFHAMDNRLWSHALIIASTMERSMWGQVVREFVRQEVKTAGENTESLSALYEIFGGNLDESIDELVPPSARAGLQMISRVTTGGVTRNSLDGLNRWKETLSLVLNNRCQGDHQALAVLAKLLQDYNRIEAAHICYLFSRNPQRQLLFGGPDEEHASIILLGANHKAQPSDFARDQDAIMLTEIYEFATSVLATGAQLPFMPHLSVFKLQRAILMSEAGLKAEAQSYCDAIAGTFGKSSKMSPYYHPLFLSELDDLWNKLKQTPIQGSSSWIGKPSLEKVGGSMWTKFSSFVAGDDSDAESKGSGKDAGESGPFARVAGTPSVSRTGSQSDLYGSYPQAVPATIAGNKYAPNGIQSARSSAELTRGRPSLDSQRSPPTSSYSQHNRQIEPMNMFQQGQAAPPPNPYQAFATSPPPPSYPQSPPRSSYVPNNAAPTTTASNMSPIRPGYAPTPPSEDVIQQTYGHTPEPIAQIPEEQPISFGGYQPLQPEHSYGGYQPSQPDQAQTSPQHNGIASAGYDPPTESYGFEPPSGGYVPYEPEPESPEAPSKDVKSKKKSFMDDDEDDFPRVSNQAPSSKPQSSVDGDETSRKKANDAAADAAFRAAAEADAAREKEQKQSKRSSSWLGGWFGGKKDESLDSGSSKGSDQKVFRAKLGESKMKLYYDKELGKWVNPDNPDAAKKTGTPPPPRMGGTPAPPMGAGGPPRPPMGSTPPTSHPNTTGLGMGLSSGPPSRVGTPADGPGPSMPNGQSPQIGVTGPPSAASTPPIGGPLTPNLAPPPRPGTAMSNASSIDDLIGPSTGRKSAKGAKKGGKGRYVDVMAK
ncbi:COPII coat assembly protein SEC16 [Cladophialophora carrionii]|uniref:Protein transport protein sec16 n=1 Tax=Cladophialophora carrionii TaxID=86049 RepID=A0A1C1CQN8_9EURO|nr:COPII coat assembly protein SEC16 [Cladophialophora carrionii]